MSIRTYKTTVKKLEATDREAREMVISAIEDDKVCGEPGISFFHEYANDALARSRKLYARVTRVYASLHPRQREKTWQKFPDSTKLCLSFER